MSSNERVSPLLDSAPSSDALAAPGAGDPRRRLGVCSLTVIGFFWVSGGVFGSEELIAAAPPLLMCTFTLCIALAFALPNALMTAELATAYPADGGQVTWVRASFGPALGAHNALWVWVVSVLDAAVYPQLAAQYFSRALGDMSPLAQEGVILGFVALCGCMNLIGLNVVTASQTVAFVCSLAPCLLFALLGLPHLSLEAVLSSEGETDWAQLLSWVLWLYSGISSLGSIAGEVAQPQRAYPCAIALLLPLAMALNLFPFAVAVSLDPVATHYTAGYFGTLARELAGPWLQAAFTLGVCAASASDGGRPSRSAWLFRGPRPATASAEHQSCPAPTSAQPQADPQPPRCPKPPQSASPSATCAGANVSLLGMYHSQILSAERSTVAMLGARGARLRQQARQQARQQQRQQLQAQQLQAEDQVQAGARDAGSRTAPLLWEGAVVVPLEAGSHASDIGSEALSEAPSEAAALACDGGTPASGALIWPSAESDAEALAPVDHVAPVAPVDNVGDGGASARDAALPARAAELAGWPNCVRQLGAAFCGWLRSEPARGGAPRRVVLANALCAGALTQLRYQSLVEVEMMLYTVSQLLFLAAFLALRIKKPHAPRPFRVPGGTAAVTFLCVPPLLICLASIGSNLAEIPHADAGDAAMRITVCVLILAAPTHALLALLDPRSRSTSS